MTIRVFQKDDAPAVLEIANKYAAFEGETSFADLIITDFFPRGFWVSEEAHKIVGFAYGYFRETPTELLEKWGASKAAYIALMAVEPAYRNRGIGSSLLSKLLQEFKEAGADIVLLDCPAQAKQAKRIFDRIGFETRAVYMTCHLKEKNLTAKPD